ncbi:MAG: dihydrodipicolinate reductase [Pseudomonadales bacterium]|jgi:4-hydroxy-tetrahydrodipicolinate reductase|nr:dihydrodipicolinate reductase [Pseudomonadales bacterium]
MSVKVMINGLPGKMASEVARAVLAQGLELIPHSFTGMENSGEEVWFGSKRIKLVTVNREGALEAIKREYMPFITVDYTVPNAVESNVRFYIDNGLPFVLGTTGYDRNEAMRLINDAKISCVVAPNMAKRIVAFQMMMEYQRDACPNLYKGLTLEIEESHQAAKLDTSGTAKAMADIFSSMGIEPFVYDDIKKIRDEEAQLNFGVPHQYLDGHAFHTYRLLFPDGKVAFEFKHNICGRSEYANGTVDAVRFLADRIRPMGSGECFSMIDVLESGTM